MVPMVFLTVYTVFLPGAGLQRLDEFHILVMGVGLFAWQTFERGPGVVPVTAGHMPRTAPRRVCRRP
jgi:hypothetical protein